jgi:hypothetical protein
MSTPWEVQAKVPQGTVPVPKLYNFYVNDTPKHLGSTYPSSVMARAYARCTTYHKEGYILRKLQSGSVQWSRGVSAGT